MYRSLLLFLVLLLIQFACSRAVFLESELIGQDEVTKGKCQQRMNDELK